MPKKLWEYQEPKTLAELKIERFQARKKMMDRLRKRGSKSKEDVREVQYEIEKETGVQIVQKLPKINIQERVNEIKNQIFKYESQNLEDLTNSKLCYMPPETTSPYKITS
mmetsp:Transcript_21168/g.18778  ORF Transcript_21168/g.18778 Transcript_21168/m.18778 type:complete len:110 (-) Transcript_21168:184-513(-)